MPTYSNPRSITVNEKAVKRRRQAAESYEYGLPTNYIDLYPTLALELGAFEKFMTQPSIYSQQDPIRPATADIYLRHAKQFLGWYIHNTNPDKNKKNDTKNDSKQQVSFYEIFPNKEKESAKVAIDFIMWLRSRDISVSYEANLLGGLLKLLKFRFAQESQTDATVPGGGSPVSGSAGGGLTFDDIPISKEIRELHRDANKRQRLSPRSRNEQREWISWPEYLKVIQSTQQVLLDLMNQWDQLDPS